MDHLLDESERQRFREHIPATPWLGFDHGARGRFRAADSLDDYATLRGWSTQEISGLKADVFSRGQDGLALIQVVATFAPWEVLSGNAIPAEDVIVATDGSYDLQTSAIRRTVEELLVAAYANTSIEELCGRMPRLLRIGQVGSDLSEWENSFLATKPPPELASVTLHVHRQIILAKEIITALVNHLPFRMTDQRQMFMHTGGFSEHYTYRLRAQGWCVSIYPALETLSISALEYFLATCGPAAPPVGLRRTVLSAAT